MSELKKKNGNKRFIVYDIPNDVLESKNENDILFSANPLVKGCVGCFSCWLKTPSKCSIKDRCSESVRNLAKCDEFVVISPCVYGGYTHSVKAIIERSIGYLLPYFRVVDNEIHHKLRYKKNLTMSVYFYGECDDFDKETANLIVRANAINFGALPNVYFYNNADEVKEAVL